MIQVQATTEMALLDLIKKAKSGNAEVIAIAGASCSGKTVLAAAAEMALKKQGLDVLVVNLDDYFLDLTDPNLPRDCFGFAVYDLPESYHLDEFKENMTRLYETGEATLPVYNIYLNVRDDSRKVTKPDVLIVDGLFAILACENFPQAKATYFLDTPVELRLKRRIERDTAQGIDEDQIRHVFMGRIERAYQSSGMIQLYKADVIVKNEEQEER